MMISQLILLSQNRSRRKGSVEAAARAARERAIRENYQAASRERRGQAEKALSKMGLKSSEMSIDGDP